MRGFSQVLSSAQKTQRAQREWMLVYPLTELLKFFVSFAVKKRTRENPRMKSV
jgi:hypothetical protein